MSFPSLQPLTDVRRECSSLALLISEDEDVKMFFTSTMWFSIDPSCCCTEIKLKASFDEVKVEETSLAPGADPEFEKRGAPC